MPLSYRFWGVRGSLPAAGSHTLKFGGNTPCLEVRGGDSLLIVDMGSGIRPLGEALKGQVVNASILMTHYHYDHVQGLPFFGPMYDPRSRFTIHGPDWEGRTVEQVLAAQLVHPYFPVGLEVLRASIDYRAIRADQRLTVGPVAVSTLALNHPGGSLGYRFELEGRSLVYCTDVEPDGGSGDQRLEAFARGASSLICDAMYTPAEYSGRSGAPRVGFGHGTWEFAARVAKTAGVERLVLCHHDPSHSDDEVEALASEARSLFPQTTAAREGELVVV